VSRIEKRALKKLYREMNGRVWDYTLIL
jgi:hypothetical protein